MRVAEPRQGRKLKYVVAERAGKVFSLFFGGFSGGGNVFAQGGKERYAHHLEQFRLPVEPSESRVDLVEQNYLSVQKAVAEFFDFVRAFCRGVDERQGKGEAILTNVLQKAGNICLKGNAKGGFRVVAENGAVFPSFPDGFVDDAVVVHALAPVGFGLL